MGSCLSAEKNDGGAALMEEQIMNRRLGGLEPCPFGPGPSIVTFIVEETGARYDIELELSWKPREVEEVVGKELSKAGIDLRAYDMCSHDGLTVAPSGLNLIARSECFLKRRGRECTIFVKIFGSQGTPRPVVLRHDFDEWQVAEAINKACGIKATDYCFRIGMCFIPRNGAIVNMFRPVKEGDRSTALNTLLLTPKGRAK